MKRILASSGAMIAAAALCVGCGSSGTPSTSIVANPTTVTATTTVVKTVRSTTEETVTTTVSAGDYPPADFYDHGNGVFSAFETNHDEFTCDAEFNRCWGVMITAPDGCPNGVALTLTIFPVGSDVAAATVDQSTGESLAPQEITTIVVGSSKLPDDETYEAEVTEAGCA